MKINEKYAGAFAGEILQILHDDNHYLPGVPMHISFSDLDVLYFKASEVLQNVKQTKKDEPTS